MFDNSLSFSLRRRNQVTDVEEPRVNESLQHPTGSDQSFLDSEFSPLLEKSGELGATNRRREGDMRHGYLHWRATNPLRHVP